MHRPHPHNLVGKEGCKKGVCTVEINSDTMGVTFSNLGIQCVKKRDIEEALRVREEIRVDPYRCEHRNPYNILSDHRFLFLKTYWRIYIYISFIIFVNIYMNSHFATVRAYLFIFSLWKSSITNIFIHFAICSWLRSPISAFQHRPELCASLLPSVSRKWTPVQIHCAAVTGCVWSNFRQKGHVRLGYLQVEWGIVQRCRRQRSDYSLRKGNRNHNQMSCYVITNKIQ